jgi:CheY-like chemotaxis protein/tetratricopeptide (TPR) repeat protein
LKTVLLAESHGPTQEHLRGLLSQAGHSVRLATDPASAFELFASDRPDAVVVAVDYPRLNGVHLAKRIRDSDQGAQVPLIAIDKGHLGKAKGVSGILDLRANAYVADPLKGQELVQKLQALLASAEGARGFNAKGIRLVVSRPPVVSGDLKAYPLPGLLHSSYRLARDGVLVVAHRDLVRRIFLLKGAPIHYDSNARQDAFSRFLVERGELDDATAERLEAALAGGLRIGAALADVGLNLEGEELLQRLRDYTREKIGQVVGMRQGRYAFYAGTEFGEEISSVDVPPLAPILEGARRTFPVRVFAHSLKAHLAEFPARSPDFGKDLGAMALGTKDITAAMQVNGRLSLKDLLLHGRSDLAHAYSLLWFLQLTGGLQFSKTAAAAPDGQVYAAEQISQRRKKKPLPPEQMAELREAAVKIITGSYFKVLGLDLTADTEAVERAYHQVATRFHPDSYPEFDTSEIQDLLDSVMDKLSASYRVLSSDEKRKGYVQYLLSRLDIGRGAPVNVEAELALQRGEAALKRKDFRSAQQAFEEAVGLNPREPEFYGHLAWATYLATPGPQKERAKAAQKLLKKALSLNPTLERVQIIQAIIEGESGDAAAAKKKLRAVLEQNPRSKLAQAALLKVSQ